MLFKARLVALMSEKGWKQADLHRATGIKRSLVSNYVTGKVMPTLDNAILISKAFGITLNELVGLETEKTPHATEQEEQLLQMFRELGETDRQEIFNYAEYKHSQKFLHETSSKEAGEKSKGA